MQNLQFCNTGNALPVVALPPRAAVHTVLAKPMALQPLLAALQTTPLFAIEDSIFFEKRFVDEGLSFHMETL
ncbi:MAG: hypothetical protein SOW15_00605 [Ruminococcus callidus]|nr:hypothetical protein [Ruminococcus callidus]